MDVRESVDILGKSSGYLSQFYSSIISKSRENQRVSVVRLKEEVIYYWRNYLFHNL